MTQQPSPDQIGTWDPDLEAIRKAGHFNWTSTVAIIVAEYRRQQAAHGIVEVRREDLGRILKASGNLNADTWEPIQSAYHRLLAAAKDQER